MQNGRSIFSVDLKALRLLRSSGFDFNAWIDNGSGFQKLLGKIERPPCLQTNADGEAYLRG